MVSEWVGVGESVEWVGWVIGFRCNPSPFTCVSFPVPNSVLYAPTVKRPFRIV